MRLAGTSLASACLAAALVFCCIAAAPTDAATAPPARVYAPYFETWTGDGLTATAQESGVTHFTLAFLRAPARGSCTLAWDGRRSETLRAGRYLSDIATLRALGGDVIPSFGGWSADQRGTEIADSCARVKAIAAAYESVVTAYDVTRLDMDVEGRSLDRHVGIDRRNKALNLVERWAAAHHRRLQVGYTMPANRSGLVPAGLAVLQNAIANGTRVDVVNLMAFDYYDPQASDMGAAAVGAARGLFGQLQALYPRKSDAQLWRMEGITILPGIDDYPRKTEVTYPADAQKVYDFAAANGVGTLSSWSVQRDNGGCPGTNDSNRCSGIDQDPWMFSRLLEPFTG